MINKNYKVHNLKIKIITHLALIKSIICQKEKRINNGMK